MPHYLVTGGAGFIGSHLCEALLARGDAVTCIDNLSTGSLSSVEHLSNLRFIEGDVNDWASLAPLATESFDGVFHYAATVGVRLTKENPSLVLDDVRGILNIARLAKEGIVKRVVFASSSEVYHDPQSVPSDEDTGLFGWSPYTVVKLFGEQTLAALWVERNIPTVSLRFFNVYGDRQNGSGYGFVTARFIEQAMAGERPTVFGSGEQTRDFVYVQDNVRAGLAAMESEAAWGEVVNVGSGIETSVFDLAGSVLRAVGVADSLAPLKVAGRSFEINRRCAAVEKMYQLLGVRCDTLLDDGLAQVIRSMAAVSTPAEVLSIDSARLMPAT